jgi:hypothetical protein
VVPTGLGSSLCSGLCAAGYYCPTGSTRFLEIPCPAGRYSRQGAGDATCSGLCRPGFYCPSSSWLEDQVGCLK